MAAKSSHLAIELRRISKRFGEVLANDKIDLEVPSATVHGIVGENGAGKSTLMSILYGFYQADAGEILIDGNEVIIRDSASAIAIGIGMVHQHFMLVDTFSVLENIMLGAEGAPLLGEASSVARRKLLELVQDYGLSVDPDALVGELPVGIRQRVEILKALYRGARILVLDEPTGVLTPQEADALFEVLSMLREAGVTVVLITHKLREIMAVTDNVSVMRAGKLVATKKTAQTDEFELAELMVGRKVALKTDKKIIEAGSPLLQVRNLRVSDLEGIERVRGVSLEVRAGEILGVAGVAGNGQSELLEALAGMRAIQSGEIRCKGGVIEPSVVGPAGMRRLGVAHVPEDRLRSGLVGALEAVESYMLGYHDYPAYRCGPLLRTSAVWEECASKMRVYDVRPPNPGLRSDKFSGGNQQKLVLARELERAPDLLLVGQPTRGVDIGAIEFLRQRLVDMRNSGRAVLLVSVELDEIMSLADRIVVMVDGRISGEMSADEANELELGLLMSDAGRGAPVSAVES